MAEYNWDPITVEIVVSGVSLLRDQAIAAWAAAGDTVIIDGVTVAEGVAGRGVFRIFGFAAFLTQIGGTPAQYRSYPGAGSYSWPDNREQSLGGYWDPTSNTFRIGRITETIDGSMSYEASLGGVCSLDLPCTVTVRVNPFPDGATNCGDVTFYCAEMVRTEPLSRFTGEASITFTGNDLGGPPAGSYDMSCVWGGCISGTVQYAGHGTTLTIGVN